jgi:predicted transcriptional regulator YdeE
MQILEWYACGMKEGPRSPMHRIDMQPLEHNDERKQAIEKMNTDQRYQAFAETGDTSYLLPGEMDSFGIRLDENGELHDTGSGREVEEQLLARYGIDAPALFAAGDLGRAVDSLLPLAIEPITDHTDIKAEAKNVARLELSRYISEHPEETVRMLFEKLNPESISSLETIRFLDEEIKMTTEYYSMLLEQGSSQHDQRFEIAERILRAFYEQSQTARRTLYENQHGLYFVFQAMSDFFSRIYLSREQKADPDTLVPFEISKGTYASFTQDKNRIYVASREDSQDTKEMFQSGWTSDYQAQGHDAATYNLEYFDENLLDMHDSIIDSGTLLTEHFSSEFADDPALLADYTTLMHSRFRAIIEEDLGFRLRDLSIREQLYFLKYAKETPRLGLDPLRQLARSHGTSSLRTFLVTAGDESLRDRVFEFSNSVPAEEAQKVFDAYGKLVESIDGVGDYLRQQFKGEHVTAIEMIVEKQLNRARNLLSEAHEYKDSPESLVALVGSVDADTHLFTDACRALKGNLKLADVRDGSLEIILGQNITEEDKGVIREIQEKYYAPKYPAEVMVELRTGLEDSFKASDTRFYLYRKNDEILTFVRFDDAVASNDTSKHMGSFMLNPRFEGGGLGQVLLETALPKELVSSVPIFAECDPELVPFYAKFGFELLDPDIDSRVPTCRIVLYPTIESGSFREAA